MPASQLQSRWAGEDKCCDSVAIRAGTACCLRLNRLKSRVKDQRLTGRRKPLKRLDRDSEMARRMERPMEALSAVERIIRDLLVFVVAMSVVVAALMVIISRMPNDKPLKRIMMALSYPVAATAARKCWSFRRLRSPASTLLSISGRRSPSSDIRGASSATRAAACWRNLRRETCPIERPRYPYSRPGAARSRTPRLRQRGRLRFAHLKRGCRDPHLRGAPPEQVALS